METNYSTHPLYLVEPGGLLDGDPVVYCHMKSKRSDLWRAIVMRDTKLFIVKGGEYTPCSKDAMHEWVHEMPLSLQSRLLDLASSLNNGVGTAEEADDLFASVEAVDGCLEYYSKCRPGFDVFLDDEWCMFDVLASARLTLCTHERISGLTRCESCDALVESLAVICACHSEICHECASEYRNDGEKLKKCGVCDESLDFSMGNK